MKRFQTIDDWLRLAFQNRHGPESIHLDELDQNSHIDLSGHTLVQNIADLMRTAVRYLNENVGEHNFTHVAAFLPLSYTETLMHWSPEVWDRLDCAGEPPSLYLISGSQIFNESCEEYRRPISIPIANYNDLRAVFRSFRDQDAIDRSWEFYSGVYVIADLIPAASSPQSPPSPNTPPCDRSPDPSPA